MSKDDSMPTEREWLIMEAIWDGKDGITSAEILDEINKTNEMTVRTERVLLHHLCRKGLVGYTVDEKDNRVYHYYKKCTREECLALKRKEFIDTYYKGNGSMAAASLLQGITLTDEQIRELEEILKIRKEENSDKQG